MHDFVSSPLNFTLLLLTTLNISVQNENNAANDLRKLKIFYFLTFFVENIKHHLAKSKSKYWYTFQYINKIQKIRKSEYGRNQMLLHINYVYSSLFSAPRMYNILILI